MAAPVPERVVTMADCLDDADDDDDGDGYEHVKKSAFGMKGL